MVTVKESDTRASVKAKVEEAKRLKEVARLRRAGAEVPDGASWEELDDWQARLEIEKELKRKGLSFVPGTPVAELEDALYLIEDLREAASHARTGRHPLQDQEGDYRR